MATVHAPPAPAPRRPATPAAGTHGVIGPNSIIQLVAVLRERLGDEAAEMILARATGRTLDHLPHAMVDEREPNRLVRELVGSVGMDEARGYLRDAGRRTADYLLANRIPPPAQWVMRLLPRRHGRRLLIAAMARHAWTFAGSGRFTVHAGEPPMLEITGCPMCRGFHHAPAPMCDYYAATFERLLQVIVDPATRVIEVACEAAGGDACRFTVS